MDKPVIAVCTPWANKPEALYAKCFIDLLFTLPRPFELFVRHERPVAEARNEITTAALSLPQVTHLLWIDDDMTFRPDSALRLLAHDLPIVGGLCFNRRSPYHPVLAKCWHAGSGLEEGYGWIYDPPHTGLIEVDGTGGAFLLVKREVFKKIGKAGWWDPQGDISEDLAFCRRVKQAGYPIRVDCGVEIGHLGQVIVDRAFAERARTVEVLRWTPYAKVQHGAPQASVVIPVYNQKPEYLAAAVESALAQTVPVEVIVVDDGSTESVAPVLSEVVKRHPGTLLLDHQGPGRTEVECDMPTIHLLSHERNRGIAAALNTGVKAMRTPWFCWLSSDDLFDPRKMELQLAHMKTTGGKCSFHRYNSFGDPEAKTASISPMVLWRTHEEQKALLAQACFVNGSTVMIHRSVFTEVGLFDTSYRYAQDWEFWNRVGQQYLWQPLNAVLGSRREFENLTAEIERNEAKAKVMREEQDRVMAQYGPRCPHCEKSLTAPLELGRAGL